MLPSNFLYIGIINLKSVGSRNPLVFYQEQAVANNSVPNPEKNKKQPRAVANNKFHFQKRPKLMLSTFHKYLYI